MNLEGRVADLAVRGPALMMKPFLPHKNSIHLQNMTICLKAGAIVEYEVPSPVSETEMWVAGSSQAQHLPSLRRLLRRKRLTTI